MKKVKRLFSILLCIALLLSSAPILGIGLFKTDASAASYTKKHEKEYYYAEGTQFVQYLAVSWAKKNADAKKYIANAGYSLIDHDLNSGAGGKYVYLGYIASKEPTDAIHDLRIRMSSNDDTFTSPENGYLYTAVGRTPISKTNEDCDQKANLNEGAGGKSLYYYAIKEVRAGDPIVEITIDTTENQSGYETVKYINSGSYETNADANKDAGGDYIYTHIKRLPQVDTTALREVMETASKSLASSTFTDESKAKLQSAFNSAKAITDAYDNYRAGTDAYSTVYSQTKIDSAKTALQTAIDGLTEKIDTSNSPKVKFYVPETIYLNPDNGKVFQYLYGVDSNGTPTHTAASSAKSAKVYFAGTNCSPTSVKITCEAATADDATSWTAVSTSALQSITFGGTSFTGATASSTGKTYTSFPVDTTCSAGTLSSEVKSDSIRFIRWRADYVLDGVTKTVYAYSICYRQPIYTAYYRQSARQYTAWNHSPAFINADLTVYGISGQNVSGEAGTTSSGSGGSSSDNSGGSNSIDASVIVDSTRYTNYNQIPYFNAKYSIIASRSNGTATVTAYNSNATSTTKTIGTAQTIIDLPITSSKLVVYMHSSAENEGDTAQCYTYINITPTLVNKTSLRKTYNDAVSDMRQQSMFTTGFDAYQNSILSAAIKLGKPNNSDTSAKINTAEMERKTGTVTTSYIRAASGGADYNGKTESAIIGTTSNTKSFILGEDVYVTYQSIAGYTLSGYTISDASGILSTGTPNAENSYYIRSAGSTAMEWKFLYTPNSYAVTYDPNGGSFNGSSDVTSTSALYQSKYTVGSVNGTVQPDPTREGYTFAGWKCDANGTTYKTNDQINWEYMKAVKFTAQWTPVSYTVSYDGNGATSGSTASSTHTYDVEKALTKNGFNREFTVTFNYNDGATATESKTLTSTFNGWATSANGAKIYDDLQTVSNLTATDGATVTLYANWTDASVAIPEATRANYIFLGWFDQNNIKHEGTITPTSDMQLTARWLEKAKYTVTFECEGVVLQSDTLYVDTMPTYSGDTPTKAPTAECEYVFSGWSPEITAVTGDVTYTAQFTEKAHDFKYTSVDKKYHKDVCASCGYETEKEAHHFETVENNDEYSDEYSGVFVSTCTDCGMVIKARKYKVELSNGCTVKYSIKPEATAEYAIATIVAPMQSGDTYFVYWEDGSGNIVGTYRTYSFFITGDCNFTPKYVPLEQYTSARNDATSISRVTGGKYKDGAYTIYTEHSVSTTVGSITGHGVIYTTNPEYANEASLIVKSENVYVKDKKATSSATTLTGLLAVSDKEISLGDTVWARSYIIDETGKNIIYGKVKELTVTVDDGTSEIGTLGCESFDLTAINAEGDTPTDPTDDTPTEQSPIEKFMSILSKLVDFIKKILEFFKISEVIK